VRCLPPPPELRKGVLVDAVLRLDETFELEGVVGLSQIAAYVQILATLDHLGFDADRLCSLSQSAIQRADGRAMVESDGHVQRVRRPKA